MTIRKSRKHHKKYILEDGPFDGQTITLSDNCVNTSVFSCNGVKGKYVGSTGFRKISSFTDKKLVCVQKPDTKMRSKYPCLRWVEISLDSL